MTSAPSSRLAILLGTAVGDALGAGTEFLAPGEVARRHGAVHGYVQGENAGFAPGEFTDDTHLTLCILGAYWDARQRGDDLLEATLRRFRQWLDARPPDVGTATGRALRAAQRDGLAGGLRAWQAGGFTAAGNGALMRAAASVVAGRRGDALRRDAVQLAMVTHPDPRSLLACWLMVVVLELLLDGADPADGWRSALADVPVTQLHEPVAEHLGDEAASLVAARAEAAASAVRDAVEHGLTGAWRSQGGYVVDTLEAAVAASLAPSYLDGVLPVVARGDDADTVAAVAGALLGARGLLPPDDLIDGLRCRFDWPTWPPDHDRALPTLAAFVPPLPDPEPGRADGSTSGGAGDRPGPFEAPRFAYDEIAPWVLAGRAPSRGRDVAELHARGVTQILDLREPHERTGTGPAGSSALDEVARLGLARFTVPVASLAAGRTDDLDRAVAFVEAALHVGGSVYLHCAAGVERTAAVAGAWYARSTGCSVRAAIDALRQRRPAFAPQPGQVAAAERWLLRKREG